MVTFLSAGFGHLEVKDKQIYTPLGIPLNAYPFKIIRVENLYPFSAETTQKFLPLTPLQERKSVFSIFPHIFIREASSITS